MDCVGKNQHSIIDVKLPRRPISFKNPSTNKKHFIEYTTVSMNYPELCP